MNDKKISMIQAVRTVINLAIVLVVLGAIISGSTSVVVLQLIVNCLISWFIVDLLLSIYLSILFERES